MNFEFRFQSEFDTGTEADYDPGDAAVCETVTDVCL